MPWDERMGGRDDEPINDYCQRKGVRQVLKDLFLETCANRPEDVKLFMLELLCRDLNLVPPQVPPRNPSVPRPSGNGHLSAPSPISVPQLPLGDLVPLAQAASPAPSWPERHPTTPREKSPQPRGTIRPAVGGSPPRVARPGSHPVVATKRGHRDRRFAFSGHSTKMMDVGGDTPLRTAKDEATRRALEETLKTNIMFAHLDEVDRQDLYEAMFEVTFAPGDNIICEGDEGDNFYVVDRGECDIFVRDEKGNMIKAVTVDAGSCFGELALMYGTPRAATVTAKTECRLWAIDRYTYSRTIMHATLRKRKASEGFLQKIPILNTLNKYELLTVADALSYVSFDAGTVIVRQGDPGDAFYMIQEGEVRVVVGTGAAEREMCRLKEADYFGEIALLTDRPRVATVIAVTPARCATLSAERFKRVLGSCEHLLRRNMDTYKQYMALKI